MVALCEENEGESFAFEIIVSVPTAAAKREHLLSCLNDGCVFLLQSMQWLFPLSMGQYFNSPPVKSQRNMIMFEPELPASRCNLPA